MRYYYLFFWVFIRSAIGMKLLFQIKANPLMRAHIVFVLFWKNAELESIFFLRYDEIRIELDKNDGVSWSL